MPFATNKGDNVKLYYEVHGDGTPLVLAHGATGSINSWRNIDFNHVSPLSEHYKVIVFDARGHGKSDKPHNQAAYTRPKRRSDVIAILDKLEITRTHYWGYSMGGYTGVEFAQHHLDRLYSLVIGGADPLARTFNNSISRFISIFQHGVDEGADSVVQNMKDWFGFSSITPEYEQRLRELDYQAMIYVFEAGSPANRPDYESVLPNINIPCLFYWGEDDSIVRTGAKEAAHLMPNAHYFSIPERNHAATPSEVDIIIPKVLEFLDGIQT